MVVKFYTIHEKERIEVGTLKEGEVVEEKRDGFEEWVEMERDMLTTPDFNDEEELVEAYEGPTIIAVQYDDVEEKEESVLNKTFDVEEVETALLRAYDNTVWWMAEDDNPDLSKAPRMWEDLDAPPEEAKEFIDRAIDTSVIYGEYQNTPHLSPIAIQQIFSRRLRHEEGFKISDIANDIEGTFPGVDERQALNIARTETGAILDTAREYAHSEGYGDGPEEDEDGDYSWKGPSDKNTTDLCEAIKERVRDREQTSREDLKRILEEEAKKYPEGTPKRVDQWSPHYMCRHRFERN